MSFRRITSATSTLAPTGSAELPFLPTLLLGIQFGEDTLERAHAVYCDASSQGPVSCSKNKLANDPRPSPVRVDDAPLGAGTFRMSEIEDLASSAAQMKVPRFSKSSASMAR